ncbi:hypothetical protein DSUL_50316 [Desulfovibrionales bacterium]
MSFWYLARGGETQIILKKAGMKNGIMAVGTEHAADDTRADGVAAIGASVVGHG